MVAITETYHVNYIFLNTIVVQIGILSIDMFHRGGGVVWHKCLSFSFSFKLKALPASLILDTHHHIYGVARCNVLYGGGLLSDNDGDCSY